MFRQTYYVNSETFEYNVLVVILSDFEWLNIYCRYVVNVFNLFNKILKVYPLLEESIGCCFIKRQFTR